MTSPRLKLCLITKFFYPVLAGGAERFRRYAPGLRERGIDLEVFTPLPSGYPELSEHEVIDDITITRFPLDDVYKNYSKFVHATLNQLQKQVRKPDVIQFFNFSPEEFFNLWRFRLQGIGTVYVSTMVDEGLPEGIVNNFKNWLYLQISVLPISNVVASTDVMKTSLVSRGVGLKRISVIPNGVDTNRFQPAASLQERKLIRQKLGIEKDDQVVLFVGSILPRKGVDLLIEAWPNLISHNSKVRLVLVGAYGERATVALSKRQSMLLDYSNKIAKMVENSPSKERIIFTGEVANVEEYMRAADLFVLPSKQEGMGNVVLEAMATGLPCILTPYIGLPSHEFGQAGREFILLNGYSPKELAFRINQLLNDKFMMSEIGQLARQWVEKNMSIDKILDQYAAMYRSLALIKRSVF